MGFEIKVVGAFQRNQQNLAEQPNTFRYKDLIKGSSTLMLQLMVYL